MSACGELSFRTATGHVTFATCLVFINLPPLSLELHVGDS
jgi:hypothetical protein